MSAGLRGLAPFRVAALCRARKTVDGSIISWVHIVRPYAWCVKILVVFMKELFPLLDFLSSHEGYVRRYA